MGDKIRRMLTIGILVYFGFGAYLYAVQRKIMFMPTPSIDASGAERLTLNVADDELSVWVTNPGRPRAIIYFGGNAENVGYNAYEFTELFPDWTTYLVNYRGYGGSTGEPSETAFFQDAIAVYDYVQTKHDSVAALGRSLGTGVSVYLARQRPIDRLILVTPFDSAAAVAQAMYPIYPIKLLLKDHFNSHALAPERSSQTLILIAGQDRVVPPKHARRLAEAFPPGIAQTTLIPTANHVDITASPVYRDQVRRFLIPISTHQP